MPTIFKVIKNTPYSDVVLQRDIIEFDTNSKLILAPVPETKKDAPRTLTIIAKSIKITDQAEITYDLDGDGKIDADTPQPPQTSTASKGKNGYPDYTNDPTPGKYPHAKDGGHGAPGGEGKKGLDGKNAPTLEIWVRDVSKGSMKINFKGQDGGQGGDGGNGGKGGGGQKGAKAKKEDAWYDGEECVQEPGQGGDGGRGGDAGWPGRGGDGGKGGIVKVFTTRSATEAAVNKWTYIVEGGEGGDPGDPGSPGTGGQGGPQGDKVGPCPERPEYHGSYPSLKGPDGETMDEIDPDWRRNLKGKDGEDGYKTVLKIAIMPR